MKCPKCGKEIADDSNFCEFCGKRVNVGTADKKGSEKKRIFFFSLFAVLLVVVVAGVVYHEKKEAFRKANEEAQMKIEEERAKKLEEERLAIEAEEEAAKEKSEEGAKGTVKIDGKSKLLSKGYVDLGLPSGTLWKKNNEAGYYTYEEAKRFRKELPSMDQFLELIEHSSARWTDEGFIFNGDNGQSIFVKASGYKDYTKKLEEVGKSIYCYTSDLWWLEGSEPSEYLSMFVYRIENGVYNWEPSSPMQGYTLHFARKP